MATRMDSLFQPSTFSTTSPPPPRLQIDDGLYLSEDVKRSNDFINSLTEEEIGALNSSYKGGKPAETTIHRDPSRDPHSQLLFNLQDAASSSSSPSSSAASSASSTNKNDSSAMLNILPTPIGGSCQIVDTKDQVPLNQSLISQSNSLAEMFHQLPMAAAVMATAVTNNFQPPKLAAKGIVNLPSSTLDSLFPSCAPFHQQAASSSTNKTSPKVVEADFGSSSSPLIAAAAAAASPLVRDLPMAFQSSILPLNPSLCSKNTDDNFLGVQRTSNNAFPPMTLAEDTYSIHHRSQQSTRWNERYNELIAYKNEHNDCNVPYLWSKNRPLSEWVKRQRHQYKLKQEGKHSALTDKREALLTQLGFVWNSRASLWDSRFQELVEYYNRHGDLKVSKKTAKHRALSVWLKRQRHACRLFMAGDRSTCMTAERMQKLLDLGVKIVKKT